MKKWQYNIELPVPRTRKNEFSFGGKGVIFCPNCQSIYYQKFWHHNLNQKSKIPLKMSEALASSPSRSGRSIKLSGKNQKLVLCPACQMIKNKEFEGQLIISNVIPSLKEDLVRLIKNFCQRAYERDPLDRLIDIKSTPGGLMATTTENQLAVKLAKKIKEVFGKNKVQIKISYSPEPSDVAYIKVNFAE